MTHRLFSRNARSSRAVPTKKLIQEVLQNPVTPIYWGKNQKGMSAHEELGDTAKAHAEFEWLHAREKAIESVDSLLALGAHKQIVNRLLEPFMWIHVVITATDKYRLRTRKVEILNPWKHFYNLRLEDDAQPEIRELAWAMKEAQRQSKVVNKQVWHLPYVTQEEQESFKERDLLIVTGKHRK